MIVESGQAVTLIPEYFSQSLIKSFDWSSSIPETLDCPTCENPRVQSSSDIKVGLTIENATGCTKSDDINVDVTDVTFYTPNIFSPDSDGLNDFFYLRGNLDFDIANLQIFDAWGGLMFEAKNITANEETEGWDGFKQGVPCPIGVYVWKAHIEFKNGKRKVLGGDVTLIR